MADQNFRVKNGINVGSGLTITTSEYQIGSTRINSDGITARSVNITNQTGISTIPRLNLTGQLYDSFNNVGTGTSVLISTGIGVSWIPIATAALQGVQGIQGRQGVQGTQGTQGVQGTQGIQGAQGFNGTVGSQGIQGIQGIQGVQGIQGTTGIQGATGTQGTQGISGPSTTINATDDTSTATLYPVMVAATGSNQTARARSTATALQFNASTNVLSSANVYVATTTPTGTASQPFQVLGGGYFSGNLGIGRTNPSVSLHITGGSAIGAIIERNSTGESYIRYQNTSGTIHAGISSSATFWGIGDSTNFTTSPYFVVRNTTGNTGIGTANPTTSLQVKDVAFETTTTTTTNTNQVAVDTFATATFRSAKYQVQVTCPGQISTLGGITTGGRGYTAGTFNVTFTTSSGNGSAAQGTLTVSNGTVGALSVVSGGTGYAAGDVLTASGGSGLQVSVGSTASPSGAILTLGSITSAGIGYTAGVGVGTTTFTFLGGSGSGAVGLATILDGVITSSALLQQPTTGTGGTIFYSGSNYSTSSVLSVDRTALTNTITTIATSGISTFTSLTAHGLFENDIIRTSSTSNGLTAGTDYYVVRTPSTTTFTLGTSIGVAGAFTAGSNLSIGFYRNSANAGGQVAYTNAITGVSTNFQVSDLLVLQDGTTTDFVEYGTIANTDILGTFAADISGANARLLLTPTYPNNTVKVARQAITV